MNIFNSIANAIEGLSVGTPLGKIAITAGSALTALYSPIQALFITCFAFTAVDMFYGIKVACKNKLKIESHKNWRGTLRKLIDEFALISLSRLLEWSVLHEEGVYILTGGVTVIVALTELWSIIENLNTLDPHGPWKALGKFLKKKGEDYIGTEIDLDDVTENTKVDSNES